MCGGMSAAPTDQLRTEQLARETAASEHTLFVSNFYAKDVLLYPANVQP
jgi:hypothetical protein